MRIIRDLVDHHLAHPEEMPESFGAGDDPLILRVTDYVAGMTDRYALATHARLFAGEVPAAGL